MLIKKSGHALAYGFLAWLYLRALRDHFHGARLLYVVSMGLALVYGLSDEYHQTFVPGRNGSLWDVAVDGAGAGAAILLNWRRERQKEAVRRTSDAQ